MVAFVPGSSVTRPSVSVVICAYTDLRFELLCTAIAAVSKQVSGGDELVVVIDHNSQLLERVGAEFVAEVESRRLRLLTNATTRGLSGARNTGVAQARGEVVVFLDDDAIPQPGWLEGLIAAFDDDAVIATGGTAAPAWERDRPGWFPDEFLWVVGCSYEGLPERPTQIRNPIGANMAFRREVIQEVGGFTDGIGRVGRTPLGCEETELSIRATRATGGRILLEPASTVRHLVTTERARVSYFIHRCWAEGISKAVVAKMVGAGAALDSERTYTTRTLPAGVLAGLRDGARGDTGGFARAAAIVAGLAITTLGYLRGQLASVRPTTG